MYPERNRRTLFGRPRLLTVSFLAAMDQGSLTLKVAFLMFRIAGEGYLRFLLLQLVQYLPVGDIAHLIVLVHHDGLLVANTPQPFRH
jgi:hypothetical protein